MTDLAQLETDLNTMILEGKALDAFERYYREDVVMQENAEAPRVGRSLPTRC